MKEIQLSQGKIAIIDDEDHSIVSKYKWYAYKSTGKHNWYARVKVKISGKWVTCHMHRLVLGCNDPLIFVDHIDGDGLSKKRKGSKSIFKGLTWHKRDKKWYVTVAKDRKSIHVGVFIDEKEAALAYNDAAKRVHGKFAKLNQV